MLPNFLMSIFALFASGSRIPKWSQRVRNHLNLEPSPYNTLNVDLVLKLSTGLVTPQYHCKCNDFYCWVQKARYGTSWYLEKSSWPSTIWWISNHWILQFKKLQRTDNVTQSHMTQNTMPPTAYCSSRTLGMHRIWHISQWWPTVWYLAYQHFSKYAKQENIYGY